MSNILSASPSDIPRGSFAEQTQKPHAAWNRALSLYTKFFCLCVAVLIFKGALVTSNDAGLAVPDWPTSYGENMFLFPSSKWVGIIFYEHVHRLIASFVGALTLILAMWLAVKEPRAWVKGLGFAALGVVILQGTLGGLTVLYGLPTWISVCHGVLGQTFFLMSIVLTYAQSKEFFARGLVNSSEEQFARKSALKWAFLAGALIYIQLIAGAIMRHMGAGLAVPDFPTTGGLLLPTFDEAMFARIKALRAGIGYGAATWGEIGAHLVHRGFAFVVFAGVAWAWFKISRAAFLDASVRRTANIMGALVLVQFTLGVLTIWSVRNPMVTSLHVVTGALLLGSTMLLALRAIK